jgi:hypothetical protein
MRKAMSISDCADCSHLDCFDVCPLLGRVIGDTHADGVDPECPLVTVPERKNFTGASAEEDFQKACVELADKLGGV